jgi:hypothetical protein
MSTRQKAILTVGMIALSALGCSTGSALSGEANPSVDDVATAPGVPAGSQPVAFVEIPGSRMQMSAHDEAARLVIRDAASWQAYWAKTVSNMSPAPPAPTVDFTRQMVLAAAMGQQRSGGFVIVIDSVYASGGTTYAVVRSVSPGSNCVVPGVLTAPVVAVRIDRAEGPVRFVKRAETRDCG